jgi:DNA recombination protein RmuC
VLEESGLRKGHEYETQVSMSGTDGKRRAPDVIVRLPENKDIVIDAKVSLVHYERYCSATNEQERQQALKQHAASVKQHIDGLSIKAYENLEGLRTLDFVFIFIPIESAFMSAFEYDQAMFQQAYDKNIIVVGPTTLLATLRTVQSIWRYERQNKNAEEIARQAGAMHDKFIGFVDDISKIAQYLERAKEAQVAAMNKLRSGRGNLVSSTLKLEKLGAKVKKKMPQAIIESDLLETDDPDEN